MHMSHVSDHSSLPNALHPQRYVRTFMVRPKCAVELLNLVQDVPLKVEKSEPLDNAGDEGSESGDETDPG